jgi:hypothetical protein
VTGPIERRLGAGLGALVAGLALACLWVAGLQWFDGDDFRLLRDVQSSPLGRWWSPFSVAPWPFYRPLGVHSYYWTCQRIFGPWPEGFLAVSLLAALAAALVTGSLARRLGMSPPAAGVATLAVLSVCATTGVLFDPTTFHYLGALLASALSLRLLFGGSRLHSLASGAALATGLLCNEIAALVPVAAFALGVAREPAPGPAARRAAPLAALVAAYLGLRFGLVATPLPPSYSAWLGPETPWRPALYLVVALGGPTRTLVVLLLCLAMRRAARGGRNDRLLAACAAWLGCALAPFVLLAVPSERFAAATSLPLALGIGAIADSLWRAYAAARPRAAALAIAALALALLPSRALLHHASAPRGVLGEQLYRIVAPRIAPGRPTTFLALYGAPGLGDERVVQAQSASLYGRGSLYAQAIFPGRAGAPRPRIRFQRVSTLRSLPRSLGRCVYLAVRPDGALELADAATARLLPAGLRGRCEVERAGGARSE